jgi:hypothetical protein
MQQQLMLRPLQQQMLQTDHFDVSVVEIVKMVLTSLVYSEQQQQNKSENCETRIQNQEILRLLFTTHIHLPFP